MNIFIRNNIFFVLLLWLFIPFIASAQVCDVDLDADVDILDIQQVFAARNTPASGPDDPKDADGNGFINVIDGRICFFHCTLPRCAIITPPVEIATIEVTPGTLDFGDILLGDSSTQFFTTGNSGTATLNVTSVTSSGLPFSLLSPSSFSIASGGLAENIDVSFAPTVSGLFNGSITLNSNADNQNPVVVNVTGRGIEPVVNLPTIDVSPGALNFGDVFVGSSTNLVIEIQNTGNAELSVEGITSSGLPFSVFPPAAFNIAESASPRNVQIGFSPLVAGSFTGEITINSNADNVDPVIISLSGEGVLPPPSAEPDINTRDSLDFGSVAEGESSEQLLTIENLGDAPLNVASISSTNSAFSPSALPGQSIPFTLDPASSQNISVLFDAPAGSAGTSQSGVLSISSNDPDEADKQVLLSGDVIAPVTAPLNNPIVGALVNSIITDSNCADVTGSVKFATNNLTESFFVTLMDQGGNSVSSGAFVSASDDDVQFSGIDACGLDAGILALKVILGGLDPFVGTPAVKNLVIFPAPVLDPVQPVSVIASVEVCGTSRGSTTVKIEGGSNSVSISLAGDNTTTENFCLDVPLRPNTQNTLIATALDDIAAAPRPSASASPIDVVHVDPSSIVIAEATSRPLTIEETELLVENGVINLDDPTNFNVSMFTVVLTIGSFPVTVSQPVAVPTTPGTVSYGGGSGSWVSGPATGGGGTPRPVTGCVTGCSSIVVIHPPQGPVIPGVIIIDGRIKTLKEFFQVTIAIQNTSTGFELSDMEANIILPGGLSPVRSGPGTNVADVNTAGEVDSIVIGDIGPLETGTGQFIIRGDSVGTHNVDVDFNGFLTGGGLPEPFPIDGSAGTSVQVFGAPTLDVVVRHPSHVGAHDVVAGEIYDLIVEITNTSPRPALYTSLDLFVGGQAELVDVNGVPIVDSHEIKSFGHIPAGRSVAAAFRVRASVQGEIIACQAIASENISLTVDTGPDGTVCNIANTYPANFVALPADQPPVVIGINPLNGQPNIPVTSSILATVTPESACFVGDTFTNVVEALINPSVPSQGIQVLSADLVQAGTFYLEELDAFNNPVKHIPTDMTVETPPAGGTTIAVLRLGLDTPHNNSQYFLKPNTGYRATLVGGIGGICSAASAAEMEESYSWTFSTEQTCGGISAPIATLGDPVDGSIDRPLNQSIVLNFTNRMNPGSFAFIPGDLTSSTFGVYGNATETAGDLINEGTLILGNGVFSNLNRTLTYSPISNLGEDMPIHIRVTDGLRDICGNPLQTPANGTKLFSFQTIPPDTFAPVVPQVNAVPVITNLNTVQVSGVGEADSLMDVLGGLSTQTRTASSSGLFSISVPLNLNSINDLSVQSSDASGNTSLDTVVDINGDPLTVIHDNIRPQVSSVSPINGAMNVLRSTSVDVIFDEDIKPETINDLNFTLEGSVIPGTLLAVGDNGFSFTPDALLDYNKTYNVHIRANGMRDLANNGLSSEFVSSFTTQNFPLPVISSILPLTGVQGTSFTVDFAGSELSTASAIVSDNPGITGTVDSATDTHVSSTITIDAVAATGLTTLGLTTLGGSTSLPFTVLHKTPVINSIVPNSGDQGTTVSSQIQGSGLTDISNISIDGTGVSVNDLGTGNDTLRNVEFVIDGAATPGPRNVTVTTPGGSDSAIFTVVEVIPAPALTSISPDNGVQGTTPQITFSGTNLTGATAIVSSNAGITGSIVSSTDTTVIADLIISASASLGISQLGVSTAGGSDTLAFNVSAPILPPVLTGITPNNGVQGTSVIAVIQGSNLLGVTGISSDCPDLGITDLGTGNIAQINVQFDIGAAATPGICSLTVTTLGGSSSAIFTVIEAPDTIVLTPSPSQMLTRGSLTMTVTLNANAPTGGQIIDLAVDNTLLTIPATVTIPAGSSSAIFSATSGNDAGQVVVTASAANFTGDTSTVDIIDRDFSLSSPLVGIDRTVTASITLPTPAPSGGATFDLSVSDTSIVTVSPATITIPQGQSSATFDLTGQFIIGIATVTADGTSNGYVSNTLDITVTDRLIDLPAAQELFLGQVQTIPLLIAPDAAGAGGVVIDVVSSDPSVVEVITPTVIVPEGTFQSSIQIRAASGATGTAIITASNAGFAPDTSVITLTASLNILQSSMQFEQTETDEIFFNLANGGGAFSAPAGGVNVTLSTSDTSCVSVPASVNIAEGISYGSATLSYAGGAVIPCTATVTVDSGVFGTDSIDVTIDQVTDIGILSVFDNRYGDNRLGSDTQIPYRVTLNNSNHGGVTIQVRSSNPQIAMVAQDGTTIGTPVIELIVPDGQTSANFFVQGIRAATGSTSITAKHTLFTTGTRNVDVVPGAFSISSISTPRTTLSPDDPFRVSIGYIHQNGITFRSAFTSAIGGPLSVNLNSSNTAVSVVKNTFSSGSSVSVEIPVNGTVSPNTVASGGVALEPTGQGTVNVSATATGFDATYSGSSVAVSVTQPGITVSDGYWGDNRIGPNLQTPFSLSLGGGDHGGVTVQISSDNGAVLLSPDTITAGTSTLDLFVADGQTSKTFYVHGVNEATGVTLTATQALFSSGTRSVDVVPSALRVVGLSTTRTTLSPDDAFYVETGYMSGTTFRRSEVSASSGPITVDFSSDDISVGQLVTASTTGATASVQVAINSRFSPTNVASGGAALEPIGQGTLNVSATATGFDATYSGSSVAVSVTQPAISIADNWQGDARIGGGLQASYRVNLSGSDHGGVTVRVASSDTFRLLVAPDSTSAGTSFIDLFIADGQTQATFYVQGINGITGNVTLTASSVLFTNGTLGVDVVPGVIDIHSFIASTTASAIDDPFRVRTGYVHSNGTSFLYAPVSSSSAPLQVLVHSSNVAVGAVKTLAENGASVTVEVAANLYDSASSVAAGGVAFDPVSAGTTVISTSVNGFNNSFALSDETITVSP